MRAKRLADDPAAQRSAQATDPAVVGAAVWRQGRPLATARTLAVAAFLVAYTTLLGPPALLWAWLRQSADVLYRLALPAVRLALWMAGIRVRVHGCERLEPGQTYLFMPNHRSNVDPPVLLTAVGRDVRMMAKAQLFRIPLLGSALRIAGFVPVVREDRDKAIAAVERAAAGLRAGRDFVIFPEGTRCREGALLPLKKGPFYLAVGAQVPVVPVAIRGTRDLMPKGSSVIYPGAVSVEVLEPIPTAGMGVPQREELRDEVQRALLAGLAGDGGQRSEEAAGDAGGGLTADAALRTSGRT